MSSRTRRIVTTCQTAQGADSRVLRRALLDEIEAVVPFDSFAWLLTDPQTWVGTSPLAEVPNLIELPSLIRVRYQATTNGWRAIDDPPVARLSAAEPTGDEWPAMLRSYGVADVLTTVFRDRFGCWAFLDLWRSGGTFSVEDEEVLAAVAPAITGALRRCQAATFGFEASRQLDGVGPAVLVLGSDLTVQAQTPQTDRQLRRLVPPDGDGPAVPASAYNVAAQLLAVERRVDARSPSARMHLGDGVWVTARAARLGGGAAGDIAVTIEQTSSAERLSLFGLACGLSEREREILALIAGGGSTRQIAAAAFVSEHTVQDHLKSIFAKTSTHSRRELASRALGN